MIYWITGRKNSGKTTLAYRLRAQIPNSIVIDGDQVRELWENIQYDKEGRAKNLELIAKTAVLFEQQGHTVIIACVSPIKSERKYYQMWFNECIEICMPFGELWEGTVYEEPDSGF